MTVDDAVAEFAIALDAKKSVLASEIRRLIVERPFLLDKGVSSSSIDAIHFEYDWSTFLPMACPMNTSSGYCGSAEPLELMSKYETELFPASVEDAVLEAAPEAEREALDERLRAMITEVYCGWFADAWKVARGANPSIRGFLSVHDTIWRTDLDSGEEFREDLGPIRFFPRESK